MTNTLFEINNNLFKTSISGEYQIENLTASFVALSRIFCIFLILNIYLLSDKLS